MLRQVPSDTGKTTQIHKSSFDPGELSEGQLSSPTPGKSLVDEKTRKPERLRAASADPAFLQPVQLAKEGDGAKQIHFHFPLFQPLVSFFNWTACERMS